MFEKLKKAMKQITYTSWENEGRVYLIPREVYIAYLKTLWNADDSADRNILEFRVSRMADVMWDSNNERVVRFPGRSNASVLQFDKE